MEPIIFTSSMDTQVTIITWGILGLFLLLILLGIYLIRRSGTDKGKGRMDIAAGTLIFVVIFLVSLFTAFQYVRHYELTSEGLTIVRLIDNLSIPTTQITEVRALPQDFKLRKTWGTNGLFGYYGEFTSAEIGRYCIYAKSPNNLVLIKTKSQGNIVISPDDISILEHLPR